MVDMTIQQIFNLIQFFERNKVSRWLAYIPKEHRTLAEYCHDYLMAWEREQERAHKIASKQSDYQNWVLTLLKQENARKVEKLNAQAMSAGTIEERQQILESIEQMLHPKITEVDVIRAREYPIERLLEVDTRGFAVCLGHKDTNPSMYVKNNWAYCFSCGYKADSIKVYQDTKGVTFLQAVKGLVGNSW